VPCMLFIKILYDYLKKYENIFQLFAWRIYRC
jgi:hypothetical protein